jgi:hypothetical protein
MSRVRNKLVFRLMEPIGFTKVLFPVSVSQRRMRSHSIRHDVDGFDLSVSQRGLRSHLFHNKDCGAVRFATTTTVPSNPQRRRWFRLLRFATRITKPSIPQPRLQTLPFRNVESLNSSTESYRFTNQLSQPTTFSYQSIGGFTGPIADWAIVMTGPNGIVYWNVVGTVLRRIIPDQLPLRTHDVTYLCRAKLLHQSFG